MMCFFTAHEILLQNGHPTTLEVERLTELGAP